MNAMELPGIIEHGEGISVEFKKSTADITKDVYDTVSPISKVFRELSLADELASGMRNGLTGSCNSAL